MRAQTDYRNASHYLLIPFYHEHADSTAYGTAHFGQGSTIIIAVDDVACTGSEATLFSCTHSTSHNCGHHEDAGAQCVPRECMSYSSLVPRPRPGPGNEARVTVT